MWLLYYSSCTRSSFISQRSLLVVFQGMILNPLLIVATVLPRHFFAEGPVGKKQNFTDHNNKKKASYSTLHLCYTGIVPIMTTMTEDEESGTAPPPYQASSHQKGSMALRKSSSNSVGNSSSPVVGGFRGLVASTFRRFYIEAQEYEAPPGEDDIDDDCGGDDDGDDDDSGGGQRRQGKIQRPKNNNCRVLPCGVLVLVTLIVCSFGWFLRTINTTSNSILYTGDSPVCDSTNNNPREATAILQQLEAFSTVRDLEHGAVAADHPTCSRVGLSILRDHHGNAVDAAVATVLCLGVANPSSSGIGGGAFLLIHSSGSPREEDPSNKLPKFHDARNKDESQRKSGNKITEVIDCREVAGEAASTDMFQAEGVPGNASLVGGLAIAVMGELRGLELAHARHGRLDWATVVRPAMELARDGIPVYPHLAADILSFQSRQEHLGGLPTLRPLLTHDNNWKNILREGDIMKNPKLAKTLEAIMVEWADAVYTGPRAEKLAEEIQAAGGILTVSDLANFRPTLRSPVVSDNIFGMRVVGVPPPSSGGAVIVGALRFLSGYAEEMASFADTLSIYRMVEAMKHAFSIRMSMGDPAFPLGNDVTNATTQEAVNALIQGTYMEELRLASSDTSILNMSQYGGSKFAQLEDSDGQVEGQDKKEGDRRRQLRKNQRSRRLVNPYGYLEDRGTSHISVVDNEGNAVAITTSVNTQFGSGIVSESTGILFNNEMNDFAANVGLATNTFGLHPSAANFIKPGKKPLSSMSPTMIFRAEHELPTSGDDKNEKLLMCLGGSGGPKIITAVLQVIVRHLLFGKDLFASMAHPRVHNQLIYHSSADTEMENSMVKPAGINLNVSNRSRSALEARGNRLLDIDYTGCVQAISVDVETGRLSAVSDIRKGGQPAGY